MERNNSRTGPFSGAGQPALNNSSRRVSPMSINSNFTNGVNYDKMGCRKRGQLFEEWENQRTVSKWEGKNPEPHKLIERIVVESAYQAEASASYRTISRNSSQRNRDFVSQIQTLPGGHTTRNLEERNLTPEPKPFHPLAVIIQQSYVQQQSLQMRQKESEGKQQDQQKNIYLTQNPPGLNSTNSNLNRSVSSSRINKENNDKNKLNGRQQQEQSRGAQQNRLDLLDRNVYNNNNSSALYPTKDAVQSSTALNNTKDKEVNVKNNLSVSPIRNGTSKTSPTIASSSQLEYATQTPRPTQAPSKASNLFTQHFQQLNPASIPQSYASQPSNSQIQPPQSPHTPNSSRKQQQFTNYQELYKAQYLTDYKREYKTKTNTTDVAIQENVIKSRQDQIQKIKETKRHDDLQEQAFSRQFAVKKSPNTRPKALMDVRAGEGADSHVPGIMLHQPAYPDELWQVRQAEQQRAQITNEMKQNQFSRSPNSGYQPNQKENRDNHNSSYNNSFNNRYSQYGNSNITNNANTISPSNLGIYKSYEKKQDVQFLSPRHQHPMKDQLYKTSYNFLSPSG